MVTIPKSGLHALMKSELKWSKEKGSKSSGPYGSSSKSDSGKGYHSSKSGSSSGSGKKSGSVSQTPTMHTMPSFSKLKSGFTIPKGNAAGSSGSSSGSASKSGSSGTSGSNAGGGGGDAGKTSQIHNPVTSVKPANPNQSAYHSTKTQANTSISSGPPPTPAGANSFNKSAIGAPTKQDV